MDYAFPGRSSVPSTKERLTEKRFCGVLGKIKIYGAYGTTSADATISLNVHLLFHIDFYSVYC